MYSGTIQIQPAYKQQPCNAMMTQPLLDPDRNMSMAEDLIQMHYPWFWDTFTAYDMEVKKADAARVFILHRYGGLYLDLDVQCFRNTEDLLLDLDFAIQG